MSSTVQVKRFKTAIGSEECFIVVRTASTDSFHDALSALKEGYAQALAQLKIDDSTLVFSRIFASDLQNQVVALRSSPLLHCLCRGAVSIIEQKPVNGGPLSLLVYHVIQQNSAILTKKTTGEQGELSNAAIIRGMHYSLAITTHGISDEAFNASVQTAAIFKSANAFVENQGMTIVGNMVRTWIYVRDVDNHYKDMVDTRTRFFDRHGLTKSTRYLASTGILGSSYKPGHLVTMDTFSINGLLPAQIIRMEAPEKLSPTLRYGVTFERGTRIQFGDRSHLYISGTASIDHNGTIVHVGDVGKQTERTVENISALLAKHGASLENLVYIIVYVRNYHDADTVKGVLGRIVPVECPCIFVEASVCRPEWLVEIEGIAIIKDTSEYPPFL